MSPATSKLYLTILGTIFGALALVPQLAPYAAAFAFIAGGLGGKAFLQRPGDVKADQ